MSSNAEDVEVEEVCANCGIAEGDSTKLKLCTACRLIKYCSIDCHRRIIGSSIKRHVKKEQLKYEMIIYSVSLMRAILANVRSAVCRCRLMSTNGP